jgi:hypothetical protein
MLTFEDVTTRGNYYPDKSMATAAVSQPFLARELADEEIESSALPPCYEYDQEGPRASGPEDRGTNEAGTPEFGR